ncbi:type I secretion system permease/ATPase [Hyphomicrobiales bacterium 4NK60-0047b]
MKNVVKEQFGKVRGAFLIVGVFSCVVNLLMLTGPIFMLQVYDRVLASQSVPTLVALLVLAIGLYIMMGLFDFLRARVLSRASQWLDHQLSPLIYRSWMVRSLNGHAAGYKPVQDLTIIRGFLGSPTVLALFDLPWVPIYIFVVFLLHFQLGLLAVIGALVVIILAVLNEWFSARSMQVTAQADMVENQFIEGAERNVESILSMGMLKNTMRYWRGLRDTALANQQVGSERSEFFTAFSKAFRLLLQSAILGLGAYLAIQQEISPGMIVAASIIAGRALAPIDQTIGGWRMIKRSRMAYKRLSDYLGRDSDTIETPVRLPDPIGHVIVKNLVKYAPTPTPEAERKVILAGLDFELKPGDGLAVIGPSASGKSSLAKLLVGLWSPDQGSIRIDGATFEQWDLDELGQNIGYLPQQVDLISGTIAQNISRFAPEPDHANTIEAAKIADVHDMILSFPEGYSTRVDLAYSPLTGGQKQRIALARAIYNKPKLVVLDEPNSNLDAYGDTALAHAITALRQAGSVVVVMAHRPSAINAVDQVLMLNKGTMIEFGDKADVLKKVTRTPETQGVY